jgi:hypothetical protein
MPTAGPSHFDFEEDAISPPPFSEREMRERETGQLEACARLHISNAGEGQMTWPAEEEELYCAQRTVVVAPGSAVFKKE